MRATYEHGSIIESRGYPEGVSCLQAPARTQIRVQPDIGQPQQRGRVKGHGAAEGAVEISPVLARLVGPELAVLFEADGPDSKCLADFLDILYLESAVDLERRQTGEGCLLQEVDVLDERVDENVVT
jgi:hypothetical protein